MVWRKTNRPNILYKTTLYERCMQYIYTNPVKVDLVIEPQYCLYRSGCNQNPTNDILAKEHNERA